MLIRRRREDLQKEGLRGKGLIKERCRGGKIRKKREGCYRFKQGNWRVTGSLNPLTPRSD